MEPAYRYRATVLRIIDGDTFDAFIDLGHDIWVKRRIRVLALDTPETRTTDLEEKSRGFKAKRFLCETLPKDVVLETVERDSFGRWLAKVWFNSSDNKTICLQEMMTQAGYNKL